MSSNTKSMTNEPMTSGLACATRIPFDSISEPGTYICEWSGHLLRVPEDGVVSGRSPVLNIVGGQPLFVTKISDNPYTPLTKAKLLAANWDVNANF